MTTFCLLWGEVIAITWDSAPLVMLIIAVYHAFERGLCSRDWPVCPARLASTGPLVRKTKWRSLLVEKAQKVVPPLGGRVKMVLLWIATGHRDSSLFCHFGQVLLSNTQTVQLSVTFPVVFPYIVSLNAH